MCNYSFTFWIGLYFYLSHVYCLSDLVKFKSLYFLDDDYAELFETEEVNSVFVECKKEKEQIKIELEEEENAAFDFEQPPRN